MVFDWLLFVRRKNPYRNLAYWCPPLQLHWSVLCMKIFLFGTELEKILPCILALLSIPSSDGNMWARTASGVSRASWTAYTTPSIYPIKSVTNNGEWQFELSILRVHFCILLGVISCVDIGDPWCSIYSIFQNGPADEQARHIGGLLRVENLRYCCFALKQIPNRRRSGWQVSTWSDMLHRRSALGCPSSGIVASCMLSLAWAKAAISTLRLAAILCFATL